jgi:preprotein translocase subunit SecF
MKIEVIKNRISFLAVSGILFLLSILSIFVLPLNLGIDMT